MKKFNKVSELLTFLIHHGVIYGNDGTELHFDDETPTLPILVVSKDGGLNYEKLLSLQWRENKPFEHLQLVWAWDDMEQTCRSLRVWNKRLESVFAFDGKNTYSFSYYSPYTGTIDPWMQKMIDNCK